MISVFLQAGLGNQFFQLFTAIAYAIEHGEKLIIPANYDLFVESNTAASLDVVLSYVEIN